MTSGVYEVVHFAVRAGLLQIPPESFDFLHQEVDIGSRRGRVGDDHAKEVDLLPLRLVAHHRGARLHHHGLDLWGHLLEEIALKCYEM